MTATTLTPAATRVGPVPTPPRGRRRKRNVALYAGVAVLAAFLAASLLSQVWTPYPPSATGVGPVFSPPSGDYWFGTDRVGADVFSRTIAAGLTDVLITLAVVSSALVVGTVWGALAGFYRGWFDVVTLRVLEMLQAFPSLLLAMLAVAVTGPGIINVIVVVALLPLPDYVRLARAEVLTKKHWQFAEAARMVGNSHLAVLFKHLVPNSMRPLLAFASINAAWVTGSIAALGYIGLGIEPGSAEWGSMISRGQDAITSGQWWISFFPGAAILLLAAAFHLIGDGLSETNKGERR
ncbi:ABC transporter permease [Microbacterium trichothecenolyticum]|uniref:ABC transporter permease n=1 Tax=Microbacterium trichothecenolyticum TaxID=69370 RepID=UPI001C6EB204|nr:ABC transporter permease [Microbacterium trichothecenolyticum]MBW9122082.1 ABC transporter permease [Microbacterium trichothecenolyticum]